MSNRPIRPSKMPRRSAVAATADLDAADGGIATVDRALSVLHALAAARSTMTLAAIAAATRLHKSTLLRMLASLAHAHLVDRRPDGSYSIGAGVERLHRAYESTFSLEDVVTPVLRALVARTRESAAFYVRHGDRRLCLHRVDSPQPVREHISVGDLLPLDRGVGGRVIVAYGGGRSPVHAKIRREQVIVLSGDRVAQLASVGAPVFSAGGEFVGALTLTMPAERLRPSYAGPVRAAAAALTAALGGTYPLPKQPPSPDGPPAGRPVARRPRMR